MIRLTELSVNPLNAELNPIRHLLALVGARHIVHVSRIRVKKLLLFQLVEKFSAVWENIKFTVLCIRASRLSLFTARLIQSTHNHPLSLPLNISPPLMFHVVSFLRISKPKLYTCFFPPPYMPHALPISFFLTVST